MKNTILPKIIITSFLFITLTAQSQVERFAYTVTDSAQNGIKWNYLRSIDLRRGSCSNILLRLLNANDTLVNGAQGLYNGVAAIAYDKKNKRVYYTPMLLDRLYYVDLRTMRTHIVKNNFTGLMPKATDQSNIITRMVITDDDYGYALTNDGKHLVRFGTKDDPVVTDLGSLVDAPGNNEMSVHNTCSSFGGDIVADDDGHLYLVTSRNHVFKINILNRIANYKGTVSGLPETFITSGVAVDNSGNSVVIVSSVDSSGIYAFNIRRLEAHGLGVRNPWLAADLANDNILKDNDDHHHERMLPGFADGNNGLRNDSVQLYPNPVTTDVFRIQFIGTLAGNYIVDVMNADGQIILTKSIRTDGKNRTIEVNMPGVTAKGIFIVRIINKSNKVVFNDKIIVQ